MGLLSFGVGLFGHSTDGYVNRLPPNVTWESLDDRLRHVGDVCTPEPLADFDGVNVCYFGNMNSNEIAILYGDSHPQAINPILNKAFLSGNIKGMKVSAQGCDVIPDVFDKRSSSAAEVDRCRKSFSNLLNFINTVGAPIISVIRWTLHLYPISDAIERLSFDDQEGGAEWNEYREYLARAEDGSLGYGAKEKVTAVRRLLISLGSVSNRLVVVKPIPEVGWDIARLNMVWHVTHNTALDQISVSQNTYRTRNKFILNTFDQGGFGDKILFVESEKIFCNTFIPNRCAAQYGGVPFYLDDDHLSDEGGKLVVTEIMNKLRQ